MKNHSWFILPVFAIGAFGLLSTESQARNPPRGPDFDCDGFDDMALGVPFDDEVVTDGGGVNILYGTASGPDAPSMTTLRFDQDTSGIEGVAELEDLLGGALAYGDFDGDGYDDLVAGVAGEGVGALSNAGSVNVLYGSSGGLSTAGDQIWYGDSTGITLYDSVASDQFGIEVAVGDFDGDGYDDLAITANGYDAESVSSSGGVVIIYGGSAGLSASGHQILHQGTSGLAGDGNQTSDFWGESLATGDFDCDGYEDLAVAAPNEEITGSAGLSHGAVTVIYGSSGGLSTTGSQWWHQGVGAIEGAVESDYFGGSLAAGNFDGDSSSGFDCVDLAIGVPLEGVGADAANGSVNIIYGGTSGLSDSGDQILYQGNGLAGSTAADGEIGWRLTVGRFDSDSYDDLAVGANEADPGSSSSAGEVYLVKGSVSGLTSSGGVRWDASTTDVPGTREAGDSWGWGLSYAAFEGDGGQHYLVVGAVGEDGAQGAVSTIELDSSNSSFDALGGVEWKQDDIDGTVANNEDFGYSMPAPRLKARCVN
ncbi:integrin alpha [Nannocystaceae bacterium ST9]